MCVPQYRSMFGVLGIYNFAHSTKMGADSSAENTQKFIYLPNFSAQAHKFGISMKKSFIGRP